jgi:hypothetical protein
MSYLCRAALALPLLVVLSAPAHTADEKAPETDYFPLKIGSVWNYKMGDAHFSVKVAKMEDVDKQPCARLELSANNKAGSPQNIAVKADGVYRFTNEDALYSPAVCFLKLPVKKGDSWKVDSTLAGMGKVTCTFKTDELSELKVGNKTYENVVTVTTDDLVANGTKVSKTVYYYAKNVGLIKHVLTYNEQDVVIELESYEPAK